MFPRQKGLKKEMVHHFFLIFFIRFRNYFLPFLPDGFHRCTTDVTPTSWSVRVTHDRRVELDSASRSWISPKQPPNFLWTMLRSLCRTGGVLLQVNRRSRHSFPLVSSSSDRRTAASAASSGSVDDDGLYRHCPTFHYVEMNIIIKYMYFRTCVWNSKAFLYEY